MRTNVMGKPGNKSETRNSKLETSTNDPSPNDQNGPFDTRQRFGRLSFVLGICFGFRISNFGFSRLRISLEDKL